MILKAEQIASNLTLPDDSSDPLVITPVPDVDALRKTGAASVDLRLGTWFMSLRQTRMSLLNVTDDRNVPVGETKLTKTHYVPFGNEFILHPRCFVLGVTLEWIRLPRDRAGYVIGRSSWGRRGLIIATATGVHPGFTGCLTLELSNVGEIPIAIKPGMTICQLFLHQVLSTSDKVDRSIFIGMRKPALGSIQLDEVAHRLSGGQRP